MKGYDKSKEQSYLQYQDANNLYGCAISQRLPVKRFKWVKDISKFDESFVASYNGESDKGYLLEVDVQYPENNLHIILTMIYHFYLIE